MNVELAVAKACVSFWLNDRSPKRKTATWEVWALQGAAHIGQVRWFSQWRRYGFFPTSRTVLDADDLRSIAQFVEAESEAHRKGRRAFREAPA
jgi:hypothetical protein